jgi:glucose/arabinose dehydrogenase
MKKYIAVAIPVFLLLFGIIIGKYLGIISPAQTKVTVPIDTVLSIQKEDMEASPVPVLTVPWKLEVVAEHLFVPWSLAFTSPNRILVTERNGNVRVIQDGKLQEKPIFTFSAVRTKQEEGLMGMTLDPNYSSNNMIYFCYAIPTGSTYTDRVIKIHDHGDTFHEHDEVVLIDHIPAAQYHAGCRVKFGPDGKLYVTTGDATDKKNPQDLSSLGGKILRINNDGSIPTDNPFPNSPVWSYGHRNPQVLDWNPLTGSLVATEHGPSLIDGPAGGDEVNIIEKGGNYGWPVVSHEKHQDGMVDPLLVFTPAIAPADGIFYTGDLFPQWKNHFLFAMLKGEGVMNVTFDPTNDKKVVSFEKVGGLSVGRIREIVQAPDGSIYLTTSNEDGRGNARDGDDRVYRIVRE